MTKLKVVLIPKFDYQKDKKALRECIILIID